MQIQHTGLIVLLLSAMLACYVLLKAVIQNKHWHFISHTSIAILLGMSVGALFFFITSFTVQISTNILFYVLIPPILFSNGYNLSKRKFFENLGNVCIFGILGFLLNFAMLFSGLLAFNHFGLVYNFHGQQIKLNVSTCLYTGVVLCTTDPVSALGLLKPIMYPKLFSVIFGQNIMLDTIVLMLFNTFIKTSKTPFGYMDVQWYFPFSVLGFFLLDVTVSVLVGLVGGIVITLMFKHFRFIEKSGSPVEIGLIFCMAAVTYLIPEILQFSGAISMMITGIFLAHFNFYNMSEYGVLSSKDAYEAISIVIEGVLFIYLGFSFWTFNTETGDRNIANVYSWSLFLFLFIFAMFTRFISVFIVAGFFKLCMRNRWNLSFYELMIISLAGLVKGAVPFALIISIQPTVQSDVLQSHISQSTIGIIVILSALLFNCIVPPLIQYLLKKVSIAEGLKESLLDLKVTGSKKRKFKLWRKFDNWVKPFLIYNYLYRRDEIRASKNKLLEVQLEEVFGQKLIEKLQLSSMGSDSKSSIQLSDRSKVQECLSLIEKDKQEQEAKATQQNNKSIHDVYNV